jgi:hypothetical protein
LKHGCWDGACRNILSSAHLTESFTGLRHSISSLRRTGSIRRSRLL